MERVKLKTQTTLLGIYLQTNIIFYKAPYRIFPFDAILPGNMELTDSDESTEFDLFALGEKALITTQFLPTADRVYQSQKSVRDTSL